MSLAAPRPGIVRRYWLSIDLEYGHDNLPGKFLLHVPAMMIDGEPYSVPAIPATYTRITEYFRSLVNR